MSLQGRISVLVLVLYIMSLLSPVSYGMQPGTAEGGEAGRTVRFEDIQSHPARQEILHLAERGIVKGTGSSFFPDVPVTRAEFITMAVRALGWDERAYTGMFEDITLQDWYAGWIQAAYDGGMLQKGSTFRPGDAITLEEALKVLVNAYAASPRRDDWQDGVQVFELKVLQDIGNDEEAVSADAELLTFDNTRIYADIDLPTEGVYGAKIKWTSSNSDLMNENGRVRRVSMSDEAVELTAAITKGSAVTRKHFTLTVAGAGVQWHSAVAITDAAASNRIYTSDANIQEFEFDVTPGADLINALIAYTGEYAQPEDFSKLPMIVRFNPDGNLDVYNGASGYTFDTPVKYQAGQSYAFRVITNIAEKTYSVWVTPPGRAEAPLAVDYKYRSTADKLSKIGKVFIMYGSRGYDPITMTRNTLSGEGGDFTEKAGEPLLPRYVSKRFDFPDAIKGAGRVTWVISDTAAVSPEGEVTRPAAGGHRTVWVMAVPKNSNQIPITLSGMNHRLSPWAYPYVEGAYALGLVRGKALEGIDAGERVNRGYAAVLFARLTEKIQK